MSKISVIMSVYSEPEGWMRYAIDSILNQTFTDFEFIIINDNPNREDNFKILKEYSIKDSRIKIVLNDKNLGLTKSLNIGLKLAKGKYIARMDADDISLPNRFKTQVEFLEMNEHIGVCGSNVLHFNSNSNYKRVIKYPEFDSEFFLFLGNSICHSATMIRRAVFLKYGGLEYNEKFTCAQDYELWYRLKKGTQLHNLQEALLKYRLSTAQIGVVNNQKQEAFAKIIRRKSFDDFCKVNNIELNIPDVIDLAFIKEYRDNLKGVKLTRKEESAVRFFFYRLYMSCVMKNMKIKILNRFIFSCDFLYVGSFKGVIKILLRIIIGREELVFV